MSNSQLNAESRATALRELAATIGDGRELDVLVVGGGINGAGIALDAASRGLRTAVIEAQDWSAGTSSRSSKLVHGGLRYLPMLDFALVQEALTERDLLLTTIAPHLVRPAPFLYPLRHRVWERAFVGAGIALYDTLASLRRGKRSLPWHRHFTRRQLAARFPDLSPAAAVGAIQYWDATVDDSRLVTSVLRTAVTQGALAASRTQVVDFTKNAEGRVNGAMVVDLETGESIAVRARAVVNATGVWTEETQSLAAGTGGLTVLMSKGIHIVVPRDRVDGHAGLILQTAKSVLFVIPWSRYWLIGTTDTPWNEDRLNPTPTAADIDYVLDEANRVLARPIDRADIVGSWAGLRPLLQRGVMKGTNSARVSREHTVASPVPGLTVIAGGKLTTYRVMARDAVDFALGERARSNPSITKSIPLVGAVGHEEAAIAIAPVARHHEWTPRLVDHLIHRYGAAVSDIVEMCELDPGLASPLTNAPAYLRAEIAYGVTHEGALHLEDLVLRRTRLSYEGPNQGLDALDEIAEIAAPLLRWSNEVVEHEKDSYRRRAAVEIDASNEHSDEASAAVRRGAPELVPMVHVAAAG